MGSKLTLLLRDRRFVFRYFGIALNGSDFLLHVGNLLAAVQQRIGQIKLGACPGLKLLNAFLLALDGYRIGVAGTRLNTGHVTLFLGIGVFPQRQHRQLAGIKLNRCPFVAGFVDHRGQRLMIFVRQRLHVKHHFIEIFGWTGVGLPGFKPALA